MQTTITTLIHAMTILEFCIFHILPLTPSGFRFSKINDLLYRNHFILRSNWSFRLHFDHQIARWWIKKTDRLQNFLWHNLENILYIHRFTSNSQFSSQNGVKTVSIYISCEKSVGATVGHNFDMQCDNMLSKKYLKKHKIISNNNNHSNIYQINFK